jgi:hypothetical protein
MAQLATAEEDGPIILELRLPPNHLLVRAWRDRGELVRQSGHFRSSTPGVGPPCRASPIARHDDRSPHWAAAAWERARRSDRALPDSGLLARAAQVGFDCCGSSPCSSASRTMVGVGHHRSNPRSAHTAAAAW